MGIVEWWGNLMKLNDTVWMKENPNLPSMALIIWLALWKAKNNLIFKGLTIDRRKIIGRIQNLYPNDNEGDFEKENHFSPTVLGLPKGPPDNTLQAL